jgi:hypothetical protein
VVDLFSDPGSIPGASTECKARRQSPTGFVRQCALKPVEGATNAEAGRRMARGFRVGAIRGRHVARYVGRSKRRLLTE